LPIAVKKGNLFTAAFQNEKRVAPHERVTPQPIVVHSTVEEKAERTPLKKLESFRGI
jgi:hypothetical protein